MRNRKTPSSGHARDEIFQGFHQCRGASVRRGTRAAANRTELETVHLAAAAVGAVLMPLGYQSGGFLTRSAIGLQTTGVLVRMPVPDRSSACEWPCRDFLELRLLALPRLPVSLFCRSLGDAGRLTFHRPPGSSCAGPQR